MDMIPIFLRDLLIFSDFQAKNQSVKLLMFSATDSVNARCYYHREILILMLRHIPAVLFVSSYAHQNKLWHTTLICPHHDRGV